jgi:predicted transcriptional regulator
MTSDQLFHILGMRHVWKILKSINEKAMTYTDVTRELQLNNAVTWRLLLLLKNSGLITREINTYHISDLGSQMIQLYNDLDTPKRISFDGGNIAEMVL